MERGAHREDILSGPPFVAAVVDRKALWREEPHIEHQGLSKGHHPSKKRMQTSSCVAGEKEMSTSFRLRSSPHQRVPSGMEDLRPKFRHKFPACLPSRRMPQFGACFGGLPSKLFQPPELNLTSLDCTRLLVPIEVLIQFEH